MTNYEQFLLDRKQGLGGSDIAAILGISPWKTPLDVYLDKTTEWCDEEDSEALARGKRAESYVLDTYEADTGNSLIRNHDTIHDKEYPFLFANIDAKLDKTNIIVEAKTTSDFVNNWSDIPEYYKTQVAHYAYITNADRVDIPVSFSSWQYKCFTYERDIEFEKQIRTKAMWFWINHVKKKIPPEPINIADTAKLYPNSNESKIHASPTIYESFNALKGLKEEIQQKQEACDQVSKNIREFIKDNEILMHEDKQLITWKNQTSSRFDSKAFIADHPDLYNQYKKESTSRVFRIK
jgi:putative phage-type endonuclease